MTTMTDTVAQLYAEINTDRIMEDPQVAEQFIYEQLIDYYEKMTENELIEYMTEMGDEDILKDSWETGLFYNKIVTKGFVATPFFV